MHTLLYLVLSLFSCPVGPNARWQPYDHLQEECFMRTPLGSASWSLQCGRVQSSTSYGRRLQNYALAEGLGGPPMQLVSPASGFIYRSVCVLHPVHFFVLDAKGLHLEWAVLQICKQICTTRCLVYGTACMRHTRTCIRSGCLSPDGGSNSFAIPRQLEADRLPLLHFYCMAKCIRDALWRIVQYWLTPSKLIIFLLVVVAVKRGLLALFILLWLCFRNLLSHHQI